MKRSLARALPLAALLGCGDPTQTVTVELDVRGAIPLLNPFDAAAGLAQVRVRLQGPGPHQEATALLTETGAQRVTFADFPAGGPFDLIAEGLDAFGNPMAFGRAERVELEGDGAVSVPFRRSLAYVTHLPNPRQMAPESQVYFLDLGRRSYAGKVALPRQRGGRPQGRGVSARGGASMLIVFEEGGAGFVGILSAADHQWRTIELPRPQELALGVPDAPLGVVAGGGAVTFVDLDQGSVVEQFRQPIGGRVLDGVIRSDGARALVVIDAAPGVLLIDLTTRQVRGLDVVAQASGVALDRAGRVAYVTSAADGSVVGVDLENGRTQPFAGFGRPVRGATYADAMQVVLGFDAGARRVLGFLPVANEVLRLDEAVPTLEVPVELACDGIGRRVIAIASGTSTLTAGLTVIDTFADQSPEGATALYPSDPDDRFVEGSGFEARQRYQPRAVGVLYGR